jgi:hypothetical protein
VGGEALVWFSGAADVKGAIGLALQNIDKISHQPGYRNGISRRGTGTQRRVVEKNRQHVLQVTSHIPPTLCGSAALREPLPLHFPFWDQELFLRVQ